MKRKVYQSKIALLVGRGLELGRLVLLSLSARRLADVLLGCHGVVVVPVDTACSAHLTDGI
eukprot:6201277-Pleurochrysis_carterae.AAC.4